MRKMKKMLVFLFLVAMLITMFSSCGDNGVAQYDDAGESSWQSSQKKVNTDSLESSDENSVTERKIIKNVEEDVETLKYDDFLADLTKAVSDAGGYFSSSRYSGNGVYSSSSRRAYLTIRIPAGNLDAFTSAVDAIGNVTNYSENAVDVTEAYVDVESRIAVLKSEEAALLDMLEKAENVDMLLTIRKQLNEVQQDLASYEAQKRSYDSRISYSTVTMTVYEVATITQQTEPGFFEEVGTTFMESLEGLGNFFRGLGIVVFGGFPYLLFFGGIIVGVVFLIRRRVRKNQNK